MSPSLSSPGLSYDTKFVHIGWELRSSLVGDTILGVQSEPACIDSYLGNQQRLKIIYNRLVRFEQYIFITVNRYLLIKAIGLQYRSMPIGQFNRLARVLINYYEVLRIPPLTRFARVSIDTYCSMKYICKGIDRYLFAQ